MHTAAIDQQNFCPLRTRRAVVVAIACAAAGVVPSLGMLSYLPAWGRMWLVAAVLFAGAKMLTWMRRPAQFAQVGRWRAAGYFLGWVGMDADGFCRPSDERGQSALEWAPAALKTALGATILWIVVPAVSADRPTAAGALGFAGLVLLLHFGIFHLLALAWQRAGAGVRPIMQAPLRAASLADFWGRRWNRGYRDASFELFFRPAVRRLGGRAGTLLAFFVSGLLHELVISVPARAGYGGPTAYFVIQGLGSLVERTEFMRAIVKSRPWTGRCFTLVFVIGPLGWLFHPAFLTRVIVPFLSAIGVL